MSTPPRGRPRRRAAHGFLGFGRSVGFVLLDRVGGVTVDRTLLARIVGGRRCSRVLRAKRTDQARGEELPVARGREQLQPALRLANGEARPCFDAQPFLHLGIAESTDRDRDFGRAVLHVWSLL